VGSLVGLIRTILLNYRSKFVLTMSFQWFFKTLNNFLHDSNLSPSKHEIKPLLPPCQKIANREHLRKYIIKCLLNAKFVIEVYISPII